MTPKCPVPLLMPENDFEAFEYFMDDLKYLKMFSEIR